MLLVYPTPIMKINLKNKVVTCYCTTQEQGTQGGFEVFLE